MAQYGGISSFNLMNITSLNEHIGSQHAIFPIPLPQFIPLSSHLSLLFPTPSPFLMNEKLRGNILKYQVFKQ